MKIYDDKLTSLSTEKMTLVQTYEERIRNLTETIKIDIEWKRKSEWYADRIEE